MQAKCFPLPVRTPWKIEFDEAVSQRWIYTPGFHLFQPAPEGKFFGHIQDSVHGSDGIVGQYVNSLEVFIGSRNYISLWSNIPGKDSGYSIFGFKRLIIGINHKSF
jgi:hypothetical protein